MNLSNVIGWLVVVAVLVASAVGAYYARPSSEGGGPGGPSQPQPVDVVAVQSRTVAVSVRAVGNARAEERVRLTPEVGGRVAEVLFAEDEAVEEGDLLLRLEAAEERAAVAEARARLERARKDLERALGLSEAQVTQAERDQRRADVAVAEARLEGARARLADRRLRAPFGGTIGLRDVSPGAQVDPDTTMATLVDLDPIEVRFGVPDRLVGKLRKGLAVHATAPAYPDHRFTGRVQALDAALDERSRSLQVEARLPNPDRELRPGMLLHVRLVLEHRPGAVIPEASLAMRGDESFVFRVSADDVAERVDVTTGQWRDGRVEVRRGLAVGDRVVFRGLQKVRAGAPVAPTRIEDPFGAAGAGDDAEETAEDP